MANPLAVIPGRPETGHFAAYPMVQVVTKRWGYHRPGTWQVRIFVGINFDFIERLAVMDDFGTLVEVAHG